MAQRQLNPAPRPSLPARSDGESQPFSLKNFLLVAIAFSKEWGKTALETRAWLFDWLWPKLETEQPATA